MSFRGALVDRAVRIRKAGVPLSKVEGTTVYAPAESAEIRVRLEITAAGEQLQDGRVLTEPTPTLMVYRKDNAGLTLDWKSSDRIRVISRQLGTAEYEINGFPAPIRKKRKVIGWQLQLRRTEENEAA